jgi:hypothetical protein
MPLSATGPTAQNFPDYFVGKSQPLSGWIPYEMISSTAYSSDAPASIQFIPWDQPYPAGVKNLVFQLSMNAAVPQATSAASTGSEGFSYGFTANIFSRQDYSANSTNLVTYTTASGGISASLGYSSTSQVFQLSWVTNSTGGTSSFSTTSADGGWSAFATGPKFFSVPVVTTLTAGEYWLAIQHSSTAATSNSALTFLSFSKLLQQWPVVTVGSLGGNATLAFSGPGGFAIGVASAITTSSTMAGSVVSASTQPLVYFAISNV